MNKKRAKKGRWTYLSVPEDVYHKFNDTMDLYRMTSKEFFSIINLYMEKLYNKHELCFIKYYLKRYKEISSKQKEKWSKTNKSENEAEKAKKAAKKPFRLICYMDVSDSIQKQLQARFDGFLLRKKAVIASYFALHAQDILQELQIIKKEIKNVKNQNNQTSDSEK